MNEIIKNYIGKACLIYTLNSQIAGTIESVEDSWLSVKRKNSTDVVNLDYIVRICEYPKNKKGKKKAFVAE